MWTSTAHPTLLVGLLFQVAKSCPFWVALTICLLALADGNNVSAQLQLFASTTATAQHSDRPIYLCILLGIFGCKPIGPVQNLNPDFTHKKRSLGSGAALRSALRDCASLGDEHSVTVSGQSLLLHCSVTRRTRSLLGCSGALLDSLGSTRRNYATRMLVGLIRLQGALLAMQYAVCLDVVPFPWSHCWTPRCCKVIEAVKHVVRSSAAPSRA